MNLVLANSGGDHALIEWIESFGSSPWLLGAALVAATLFSEDLTCITAGVLAAKGWLPLPAAAFACALGIWLGDMGLYGLGRLAGRSRRHWKWAARVASPERVARGRRLFEVYGVRWVFLSRFLPGMRLPSYIAAGVVGWSFRSFSLALAVAAVIWTPILCGLAFFAGRAVLEWVDSYQKWAWPILIGAVLVLWFLVRLLVPLCSWRGRGLLRSRWIRLRRWEFWPVWAVYPPVVVVLLWQAIRRRGATLFTCCDPAIPHSGVAMESKGDILDALACPDEGRLRVAGYRRLAPALNGHDRVVEVRTFLQEGGFDFPVVLKPDVGERGQGVAIARGEDEARRWLDSYHGPAIVQEFIGGLEFGVLWSRGPDEERGVITSIAGKHPQQLTGDGERTLERLILDDERAVAMARYYLSKFDGRLEEVPGKGERIDLTEIGTHARGAVFTDERHLGTEALREAFDQLGDCFEGFHLGRYDLRVPTVEDLREGRRMVILELNGVTGEPIHVYQPGYPWWKGMRDLCGHWVRACALGAANRARGATPTSVRALLSLARAHRRQTWFEADGLLKGGPDD